MREHGWRHAGSGLGTRRRGADPAETLQRAVGNRGLAQVLSRQRGTFENTVRVGSLGPIEVKESSVGDWVAHKADAGDLVVTSVMGKHSEELRRKASTKDRVDKIEVQVLTGQNSWVVVTFTNARLRGYEADSSGNTEHWKAVDFDHVDIKRTSIGVPRP
jgi:phosphosulfolactate synthase (CoM biosynthesis protein A)